MFFVQYLADLARSLSPSYAPANSQNIAHCWSRARWNLARSSALATFGSPASGSPALTPTLTLTRVVALLCPSPLRLPASCLSADRVFFPDKCRP